MGAATHGDRRRILHPRPAITAGRAERTDRLRRPGHAPRSAGAAFAGPTRSPTVRDNWPAAEPASASCPQPSRSGATGVRLATSRSPAAPDRRSPVSNVPRPVGVVIGQRGNQVSDIARCGLSRRANLVPSWANCVGHPSGWSDPLSALCSRRKRLPLADHGRRTSGPAPESMVEGG